MPAHATRQASVTQARPGQSGDPTKDAEQLLGAVSQAAGAVGTRLATCLTVFAYVAVTVASTTHATLFEARNVVTLPVVNVSIPIIGPFGFYTLAPWLIVLLHAGLLLQVSMLITTLGHFREAVKKVPQAQQVPFRERIPRFYYVLYLAREAPSRVIHVASGAITWVVMVVIPIALLLAIQVRFLPVHSARDTMLHRGALLADVALLLALLSPPLTPPRDGHWWASLRAIVALRSFIVLTCAVAIAFSFLVATIPDQPETGVVLFPRNLALQEQVLIPDALDAQVINVLRDGSADQQTQALQKVSSLDALQGRDFRFANFFHAILPRLDLRARRKEEGRVPPPLSEERRRYCDEHRGCEDAPECTDATIVPTALTSANLQWTLMQRILLDDADLEDANLASAQMADGSLWRARLNRAILRSATLSRATLGGAKLCGADLTDARLEGVNLSNAQLQGAILHGANLTGANLEGADLRGVDLSNAALDNTNLRHAKLQGATTRGATTRDAILDGAELDLSELAPTGVGSDQLLPFLVALACSDGSIGHGITLQASRDAARDSRALASALLAAAERPQCAGMRLAPEVRASLEHAAH